MKRFLGLLAVASLAACVAPGSVDSVAQPIINGTTDSGDPAVVMVMAHQPGSNMASLCTGTIVSPHVVLTAAHCVDPVTLGGSGAIFDVFPGTMPSAQTPSLAVKETHFDSDFSGSAGSAGDVGVVILTNPSTTTPVPYNRSPLSQTMVGNAVRIIGYGITSGSDTTGTTAGTKHEAPDKLAAFDDSFVYLQDGLHGICEGDSGGPALLMIDGTERVIGVTSFGYDQCPVGGTGQPGQYAGNDTRIDADASFIDQWVLMFDPPAKKPGDSCGSDADCAPRTCEQTSVGKICVQSCDPAAMPSTCPSGTMCMSVDGANLCAPAKGGGGSGGGGGGGGCSVAPGRASAGCAVLLAALLALLALRRRARRLLA